MPFLSPVRARRATLFGLLACAGCASSIVKLPVVVDPPTASVYVNGEKVGPGGRRVYELDFGTHERACVQIVAFGFEPQTVMLTKEAIDDQIRHYREYTWTLRQER